MTEGAGHAKQDVASNLASQNRLHEMGRWGESGGWDDVLYAHVVMLCHLLLVGITTFFLKSPREKSLSFLAV